MSSTASKDAITLPNHNCDDSRPTLKELLKYKDKISCKWKHFAVCLGINEYQFDIIDHNNPNDMEGKCYDMLKNWLQNEIPYWCHFIKASNAVNLDNVAKEAKQHVIKAVDLGDLKKYLHLVPEDKLQCLVICLLQHHHNTVDLNGCAVVVKRKK